MARTPNLDVNDKLVKRGLLVSWNGYRADVQRVRMGRCLVRFRSWGRAVSPPPGDSLLRWLPCTSVQVVSP